MGIPFSASLASPHLRTEIQKVKRPLEGIDSMSFCFVEGQPQSI